MTDERFLQRRQINVTTLSRLGSRIRPGTSAHHKSSWRPASELLGPKISQRDTSPRAKVTPTDSSTWPGGAHSEGRTIAPMGWEPETSYKCDRNIYFANIVLHKNMTLVLPVPADSENPGQLWRWTRTGSALTHLLTILAHSRTSLWTTGVLSSGAESVTVRSWKYHFFNLHS